MQLQPEMTTATLGGIFNDQLLALECLARKLPPGWRILVKENPKQTAFMRGRLFWQRFDSIPNVVLVPMHTDTFTLTAKSQFVATITGTVGWGRLRAANLRWSLGWPGTEICPACMNITTTGLYADRRKPNRPCWL